MPRFTRENLPKILAMLREQSPDPSDDDILSTSCSQIESETGHQTVQIQSKIDKLLKFVNHMCNYP